VQLKDSKAQKHFISSEGINTANNFINRMVFVFLPNFLITRAVNFSQLVAGETFFAASLVAFFGRGGQNAVPSSADNHDVGTTATESSSSNSTIANICNSFQSSNNLVFQMVYLSLYPIHNILYLNL